MKYEDDNSGKYYNINSCVKLREEYFSVLCKAAMLSILPKLKKKCYNRDWSSEEQAVS